MAKAKTPKGRRTPTAPKPGLAAQPVLAGQAVGADAPAPKKRTSIPQFFSQVRAEGRKIVWPSRKETWITSVMVFIMVLIAAVFFWIVDWALSQISLFVLSIGQ